jgi:aspartyl/asparaginyl beta-hydroxylase (cupin superfamily)
VRVPGPPGACRIAVGDGMHEWAEGTSLLFDDAVEHEAWNDSDEMRYILICDIWSPRLSPGERVAIAGVIAATDAFNGKVPASHI